MVRGYVQVNKLTNAEFFSLILVKGVSVGKGGSFSEVGLLSAVVGNFSLLVPIVVERLKRVPVIHIP